MEEAMVGLVVLAAMILFLLISLIILFGVAIYLLFWKLRQHEQEISDLQLRQNSDTRITTVQEIDDVRSFHSPVALRKKSTHNDNNVRNKQHLHASRPMTLMIQREHANVYGFKPHMPQVMQAAQDFYEKAGIVASKDVTTESVNIIDTFANTSMTIARSMSNKTKGQRPTSLYPTDSRIKSENINPDNKGMFLQRPIGPSGGVLELSGVRLEIPKDALERDTDITLGIVWDKRFTPTLSKKQALLSPIILCQPNGLQFKKPVTLKFPHCAKNILEDWNISVLKSEGSLDENNEWKKIEGDDTKNIELTDSEVSLRVGHFTLYTCSGESNANTVAVKLVNLVAFASKFVRGVQFKSVLYCINRYKELDDIQPLMKLMGKTLSDSPVPLFLHDNGNDIIVEADILSKNWTMVGDTTGIIPFEMAWHSAQPHCTFVFNPKQLCKEISCEFSGYQNSRDNSMVKLRIDEKETLQQSPISECEIPLESLYNTLVILLDPENAIGNDWTGLADYMGLSLDKISWLKTQPSPTRTLLVKWIEEDKKSFLALIDALTSIGRIDAAETVRESLPEMEETQNTASL